jgi:hypothetical protein
MRLKQDELHEVGNIPVVEVLGAADKDVVKAPEFPTLLLKNGQL